MTFDRGTQASTTPPALALERRPAGHSTPGREHMQTSTPPHTHHAFVLCFVLLHRPRALRTVEFPHVRTSEAPVVTSGQ